MVRLIRRLALGIPPTVVLAVAACTSTPPQPRVAGNDTSAPSPSDEADDDTPPPPPSSAPIGPNGNQRIRTFDEAKKNLTQIYDAHRIDLYCGCTFAPEKGKGLKVDLAACKYVVAKDATRAARIEWEHAIAASWFGKTFTEWTNGDDRCVDGKGKRYKGRKCAERSAEFARMEGDMHNLFPVVGEVNGLRSDFPMGLPDASRKPDPNVFRFGACASVIDHGVFLPRAEVRGDLARASLYMNKTYPERHLLDEAHRAMFEKWSAEDPPDDWERERNRIIKERQGNSNPFIDDFDDRRRGG